VAFSFDVHGHLMPEAGPAAAKAVAALVGNARSVTSL
jgi:hypothetical protein